MIFISFSSFGTTGNEKENDKDQEVKEETKPNVEEEPQNGGIQTSSSIVKADTTESSFKKFNYIFYFIYKYKYENDPNLSSPVPEELSTD